MRLSIYDGILGFFHGARIYEAEGFQVGSYGAIVADIASSFGEFLKHEGDVIQTGDYRVSESPLKISKEAYGGQKLAESITHAQAKIAELATS